MTIGKAIPRLQFLQDEEYRKSDSNIQNETVIALGMAIKALEQPKIVRCKDCRWFLQRFVSEGRCIKNGNEYHKPDWFCADGKRKGNPHD